MSITSQGSSYSKRDTFPKHPAYTFQIIIQGSYALSRSIEVHLWATLEKIRPQSCLKSIITCLACTKMFKTYWKGMLPINLLRATYSLKGSTLNFSSYLALDRCQHGFHCPRNIESIAIVVEWFFKMAHFIPCNKPNNVAYMIGLYFKEVMRLHGIPRLHGLVMVRIEKSYSSH